jgi:hypothetical protein
MRRGSREVNIVTAHPIIDRVLDQHRESLGGHGPAYRNHVYRCLNYHQLLLREPIRDSAAVAWAVHDRAYPPCDNPSHPAAAHAALVGNRSLARPN